MFRQGGILFMELRYYYTKLDPRLRQIYLFFSAALHRQSTQFDSFGLTPPQINQLLHFVLLDHPELCCFEGKWGLDKGICPIYTAPPHHETLLTQAADVIYSQAKSIPSVSDAVRFVYDQVRSSVIYDPYAPHSQTAYGALVEHRAACKGISKAFQLIMHRLDIPCILVEGSLDQQMKHVWNMVNVEGQWCHVDICMSYPQFYPLTNATDPYSCFCISTQTLLESHQIYAPNLLPTEVFP